MDNYECFISDADIKTSLSSPGPSSGYCSSDESHPSRYNGDTSSKFRETDSPWRGGQVSPFMTFSSDPCMADTNMLGARSTGMSSSVDSFSDIKSSLSFEDLMDTLWDPFTDMSRVHDYSFSETIADVEMSESPSSVGLGQSSTLGGYGVTPTGGESSLLNLLKGYDRGAPVSGSSSGQSVVYSNFGTPTQSGFYNSGQFNKGGSSSERNYFNSNPNVSMPIQNGLNQQRKTSIVSPRDGGFCQSLHQHMASMTDLGSGDCDESDYILQLAQENRAPAAMVRTTAAPVAMPVNKVQMQNSTIFSGVFSSQRSPVSSLRTCEPKAFTRIKGGVVASSCGSLLRHSVTAPALNQSQMGRSYSEFSMKNGFTPSPSALVLKNCERSASSCDMKGGRTTSAYPGLDDHRYTLKPMSNPPAAKLSRSRKSALSNHSSTSSLYSMNGPGKTTSILEAFLRSTRPMDPNKGSNAALAAEGLAYFRPEEKKPREMPEPHPSVSTSSSGMLLKKLLTGEIDQRQVLQNEEHSAQDRLICPNLAIDSPLTDGFGLDVDLSLDDSQILGGMNLLDGTDMPDITDSVWLGDLSDELAASELDEILAEQTRQDDLWLEHYTDKLDDFV